MTQNSRPLRGRGASTNLAGRFERLSVELEEPAPRNRLPARRQSLDHRRNQSPDPPRSIPTAAASTGFRPAGLGCFARSKGGHLHDDPRDQRALTILQLESLVSEFVTLEMGMVLQNLALMTQALGLGGFPHWAAHPFGWLEALGFRMCQIRGSRYLAMPRLLGALARLLGKDPPVGYALGLEKDGQPLLTPYCPPWVPSMEAAVRAVVELKFGQEGVFRGGVKRSAWKDPSTVAGAAKEPSPEAIDATVAFCDYVYRRYGRFPAYTPPFRTVLGYQASHVDVDFYDRFYKPEALSETQRRHMEDWHDQP